MTKSDDKRVPALRFKGFTDEWEQRKISEIYVKSTKKNDLSFAKKKVISVATMSWNKAPEKSSDSYMKTYNVMKKGDIAFEGHKNKKFMFGRFVENDLGDGIVSHIFDVYRPIYRDINITFWKYYINSEKVMHNVLRKSTTSATMMHNLVSKDFLNQTLLIPSNSESAKIGLIESKIDNLITLQQRKLTELQLLRTSLNQQLLKENSSWKSVKLREILNIRNKQIFPNQQYPLMSFVQKQGVVPKSQRYNRDFLVKGNKKYKVTEKGDFIYSSNNLETGSIGINKTGNATISPVYSIFSSKNYKESLFIGLLSEKKSFIYKMIRFRQGVVYGQWKIPEKDFLNIKIKIPNYQEQEKIITLFTHIDNQFKQENKKLTDLQNFKQFLLQNMFI